jgi:hypothetical protein
MKKVNIIIFILLSIVCFSCKRIYCPAFPAELDYFPYSKGQELFFSNSHDTLCFVIIYQKKSDASNYDCNSTCDCDIFSTFTFNNSVSLELKGYIFLFG